MCYYRAQEKFAMPGAGDSAGFVIGISAGTYYRAVADAAKLFVGHTPGRRARSEVAMRIACHGAYGAKFMIGIGHRAFKIIFFMVQLVKVTIAYFYPLVVSQPV